MDVFLTQGTKIPRSSLSLLSLSRVLQMWLFPLSLTLPTHFLVTKRIGTLDRALCASWQSPYKADAPLLTSPPKSLSVF